LNPARAISQRQPAGKFFRMGFHAINPDAIAPGVEVLCGQLAQLGINAVRHRLPAHPASP
jgi:hypothetical protein